MKSHKITIKIDQDCQMVWVGLDGEVVLNGNFWDFHPRSTGITQYGEFQGHWGLVNSMVAHFLRIGEEGTVEELEGWRFNDNTCGWEQVP